MISLYFLILEKYYHIVFLKTTSKAIKFLKTCKTTARGFVQPIKYSDFVCYKQRLSMIYKIIKKIFKRKYIYYVALILAGLAIVLVLGEFSVRTYYSIINKNQKYYVFPPNLRKISKPIPGIMPGVTGIAHFNVNSDGIRGDEISSEQQYRILAIGSSDTECPFIDQEKSWPYVLQRKLNSLHLCKVWVGNVGVSSLNTREHFMHMKYLLPQYPGIDTVIILAGCNDLARRLIEDKNYDPYFLDHYEYWEQRLIKGAFSKTPYFKGKYQFHIGNYDELAIVSLIRQITDTYFKSKTIPKKADNMLVNMGNVRSNWKGAAEIVEDLPDLTSGLEEYRKNINAIIDIAQFRSVRIIFMTHPSLWKKDMTEQEKNLLWLVCTEGLKSKKCYSEKALMRGMQAYNDALLQVCRARGVECIDLGKILPKSSTIFYDDVHFTDKGSLMAADVIFNYFIKKKPFIK